MFKVNRGILIRCCLLIILVILLQPKKELFSEPDTADPGLPSVTPVPLDSEVVKYEIGAVSKFGDTVVLLREEDTKCKPTLRTRNVRDIMTTSAGLRKDLRKFGDIMSVNFRDDSKRLAGLFTQLDQNRNVYSEKSENDLSRFEENMSVHFSTGESGYLMSYPTESCGKVYPSIVHIRVVRLGDKFDHANWTLSSTAENSEKVVPVRISKTNNFLYVKVDKKFYALTVVTSRDASRNTTHDIDLTLLPVEDESELVAPPNTLQIWENPESLTSAVVKEHSQFQDYFKDALYRIQRRVVSLTGKTLRSEEQQLMSVTLPPIPDSVTERDLYVKKINAEVTSAMERALAAAEEAKGAVELHEEATRVALDALAAKTQSELKLTQKKEELENLKKRLKTEKDEYSMKKRESEMKVTSINKLDIMIEQNTKRAKLLNQRAKKSLSQPNVSSEVTQASKNLQDEANGIMDDVNEFKRERSQLKQQENGLVPELDALDTDVKVVEQEIETMKDIITSAEIANRARTDTMAKTTSVVSNLRKKIEPAKKAEQQMNQIAKQIEQEAKSKLAEFDKNLEVKAKKEADRLDRQFAADQAAEARAREERLTYEAKIKASELGRGTNINETTRKLLLKASKDIDSQREAASRLEEQVDSLVNALGDQNSKVTESFTQSQNVSESCPSRAQFLKYYL